jgi:hypothetical protein
MFLEKNNLTKKNDAADRSANADDEEFLQAKDLANYFIKTIKSFRLYPGDNPTLVGMKEQLFKRFQSHLERYSSFLLEIREYEFCCQGKRIYEDQELKGSLPFLFYKDGLRELCFMEGVEEWEVRGLIDIIIQRDNINEFEDDLVTLIWEKDFIHIGHTAVDQFLEETPVLIPETAEQFRGAVRSEPMPASARGDFEGETGGGGIDFDLGISGKSMRAGNAGKTAGVYQLTAEELDALHKEVEGVLRPDFIFEVVDVLFEILTLEKDPEPYPDVIRVLRKILDALLDIGEFEKGKNLIERLYALGSEQSLEEGQIRVIEEFAASLGDPQHMNQIGAILEKGTDLRLEEVSTYLLLLRPNAIPGLIKILGDLTNSKGRRMLCDVISEVGKDRTDLIVPQLDDPRWYLIRNLVYILGKIGQETSMPHLHKVYGHGEPRVRREVVQAVALIGGARAMGLLTKALKDSDLRIRSMAAINLARVAKKAALPALLEVIQGKDFPKRESAEVKAFFDAVGSIKANDALRPLQQILEQKGWFGGRVKDEVRVGAACGIALIGTPEAKEVLKAGADSREEGVRRACLEARRRYGI